MTIMDQYRAAKEKYPDMILLLRFRDFHECFNEDAEAVAKTCGLTISTRRWKGGEDKMCGFPHHCLETYLRKLISAGHRVAIMEEVTDAPETAKIRKETI